MPQLLALSLFSPHTHILVYQGGWECIKKSQNDEQIYIELKNMKQKIERVEVYYERIQKLAHGLQVLTTNNFFTTLFRVGL